MREILLVRHGRAVDHATGGDAARSLAPEGRRMVEAVGRALARLGLTPDAIWHSPYVRAAETASILHRALSVASIESAPALTPDAEPARAARLVLDARVRRLLVVSHMPLLPALAHQLVGARLEFGTATVAHVLAAGSVGTTLAGLWSADLLAQVGTS